ncbi:MAG: ribose-5-phosphate isomerase RpiA [Pseudomonadota bacterium]
MPLSDADLMKYRASRAALSEVRPGMMLGLGSGSTAEWFVKVLAEWSTLHDAKLTTVPTSERTGALARELGLNVVTLDAVGRLDLTVDGADEFDADLVLIKGGGGAHLREKIVARASDRMVVIADPGKEVATLGAFKLPVEVIPFGHAATRRLLADVLGGFGYQDDVITLRGGTETPYRTDEGNLIYDLDLEKIADARALAAALSQVTGLVEHGLFVGIASAVYLGHAHGGVERLGTGGLRSDLAFDDGLDETAFLARWGG